VASKADICANNARFGFRSCPGRLVTKVRRAVSKWCGGCLGYRFFFGFFWSFFIDVPLDICSLLEILKSREHADPAVCFEDRVGRRPASSCESLANLTLVLKPGVTQPSLRLSPKAVTQRVRPHITLFTPSLEPTFVSSTGFESRRRVFPELGDVGVVIHDTLYEWH